ncbi:MAG: hypothetical protein M1833_003112 [Piccolia ochrophora]|nr:MAG: hypothetical protein M1833_003112 [Piccolia ochrophora]
MPSSASSSFNASDAPHRPPMQISLPPSRIPSNASTVPTSPTFNLGEDISRFPSESLHSFSFAHQSEDYMHGRQNVIKRSIDFLKDRLGWAASNPGIAKAQAKISGDHEVQNMMDLLSRAKLIGSDGSQTHGLGLMRGPLTGPADVEGENVFEKTLMPESESPEDLSEATPRMTAVKDVSQADSATERSKSTELYSQSRRDSAIESLSPLVATPVEQTTGSVDGERSTEPSSPRKGRPSLKRTYTDLSPLSLQSKLVEALAQPYVAREGFSGLYPTSPGTVPSTPHLNYPGLPAPSAVVHGHTSRWAPAAQAIFTTEATSPWTILAANDLACLVFGVTKAEVRKLGILEVVRVERRAWLEEKLNAPGRDDSTKEPLRGNLSRKASPSPLLPTMGNGVTAQLLSKPSWRDRRSKTDDGSGSSLAKKSGSPGKPNHANNQSRGVLLCGDVVPIQKRNGATGAASLWVKEKRGGLIWVLEEINEDVAYLSIEKGLVKAFNGATSAIWGEGFISPNIDIRKLIPQIPREMEAEAGNIDFPRAKELHYFAARNASGVNIPTTIEGVSGSNELRVSSFPHIAGVVVISASTLQIMSSNSVFSANLFGQPQPNGLSITALIPGFDNMLQVLTEEDGVQLTEGIVVPEHNFRRARAVVSLREGKADAAAYFLRPSGLPAKHRDGSDIRVDLQMRVVKNEQVVREVDENVIEEKSEDEDDIPGETTTIAASEVVYALWITYSRQLHAVDHRNSIISPLLSRAGTPPHQPSPGQPQTYASPEEADPNGPRIEAAQMSQLSEQIKEAASQPISVERVTDGEAGHDGTTSVDLGDVEVKKTINDFVILEDMGQGAYGQVKLARYKMDIAMKVVLKYVTKRRILVDTWTRDRRLGTVPLEIHVLDYLRRDGLRHPNIVEMIDFFEDDVNYYIEMVAHGLPGMDLFDYIELRVNMTEAECRSIFRQVVDAIYHLHTKALVVHRDIKDENVVLDGEGNIKLIDFGSAAYIKNGPFDVFVGTIDYAAPEVLAGKPYRGKEQDVWALGILLYTIVYKENPFYSVDEIMDHDLRVPYVMSDDNIDLIRRMLDRNVQQRLSIREVLEHPWLKEVEGEGS